MLDRSQRIDLARGGKTWHYARPGWFRGILRWMCEVVNDGDCVAIFHSIHRVMKAEQILLEEPLDVLLIPVPRQLSADCGMALRFAREWLDPVRQRLAREGLPIAEIWQLRGEHFERLR